jgi:hypothetical protein
MRFLAMFPGLEAGPVFLIGSDELLCAELRVPAPTQRSFRQPLKQAISDTLETAA